MAEPDLAQPGTGLADAQPSADGGLMSSFALVAAGFLISFFLVGGGIDTVGVFLNALAIDMGWSRSSLSLAVSVGAATAAVSTPFVGMLIDRFGVRVPMTVGMVLLTVGFVILTNMDQSWHFIAANVFLGPGFAAVALLPITVAIAIRVQERKALALGIAAAGASAGALILAPTLQAITEAFGWRSAYLLLGAVMGLTAWPLLLFVLPRGRLRRTDAAAAAEDGNVALADMRRPGAIPLAAVMILPGLAGFSVSVHLVPLLSGLGHSGATAAAALGTAIGISAIGKIAGGFVGDRFGTLLTLRLALALGAAACVSLVYATSLSALGLFIVLHGLALGTQIALVPVIAVSVLGAARFGTLFGLLQVGAMLASAVGPVLSGVIFDVTGSYGGAIVLWFAAIALAGAFAFWIPAGAAAAGVPESEALA